MPNGPNPIVMSRGAFFGTLAGVVIASGLIGSYAVPGIGYLLTSDRKVHFWVQPNGKVRPDTIKLNGTATIDEWDTFKLENPNLDYDDLLNNKVDVFGFSYNPYRCYYSSGGYAWYKDYPPNTPQAPPCP